MLRTKITAYDLWCLIVLALVSAVMLVALCNLPPVTRL